MSTKIEWTNETINPLVGCSKISEACENCYAEKMAWRLKRMGKPNYQNVVDEHGWTGKLSIDWTQLDKPLYWKRPRRIFIGSMTDMFHPKIDADSNFFDRLMHRIRHCHHHTFMLLTKRAGRMQWVFEKLFSNKLPENLWLGVTAENQQRADERIPILLQIPAAVRFVSVEPMLSKVDLSSWLPHCLDFSYTTDPGRLDWVIVGGETGSGARLMESDWARSLREQCTDSEVPFFFKKHGDAWCCLYGVNPKYRENSELDGQKWEQMPEKENQD